MLGRLYEYPGAPGFVQSEEFVIAHGGNRRNISIFGQESNPTTWRLAHMNLAIHSIEANLGPQPADTFLRDLHPDLKAAYILANPPFNVSDWSGHLLESDVRWRFGKPPSGNANYAWIQHFIHHMEVPNGRGGGVAGFVMANGSLSSNTGGEGDIRRRIVEADLVECIVAMPPQLFYTTGIPVCLWFLTRDKTGRNLKHGGRDRKGETLFIDARKLGTMQTRTLRVLTDGEFRGTGILPVERGTGILPVKSGTGILPVNTNSDRGQDGLATVDADLPPTSDIGRIVYAFRQWRGEPAPPWWDARQHGDWTYRDIPGFCKAAGLADIEKHGFVLTPGRYVGAEEQEDDGEPFAEKFPRLVAELEEHFTKSARLAEAIRVNLQKIGGSQYNEETGGSRP